VAPVVVDPVVVLVTVKDAGAEEPDGGGSLSNGGAVVGIILAILAVLT